MSPLQVLMPLLGIVLGTMTVTWSITYTTNMHTFRSEAVKHGAAVWVADQTTGEAVFKWKDEK